MKYFQSQIEKLLYVFLVFSIGVSVTGALLTYAAYERQNRLMVQQEETLSQLDKIAKDNSTILTQLQKDFGDANAHLNCIFEYFATAGRTSNSTIALTPNQQACDVNINPVPSALGGSTGSTKSGE